MPDGWRVVPFSEAVLINPPVRLEARKPYPFVDMASVSIQSPFTSAAKHREYTGGGSRFRHGDTLMARITPCLENGKIGRYRASDDRGTAHGSTEFIVIRGRPGVTRTDFAHYLTKWRVVRDFAISQMTGTSGRQRVPTGSLSQLAVPVPPLREQRAIAHLLGTLDAKIELNRRMEQTLAAMKRALFKSWFVDFDPVRAKMEGRGADIAEHIADLFPDRLVPSELGRKPEGWEVAELGDCVDAVRGLSYKGSRLSSGGLPMHNLNSVHEGGGYKEAGIKFYDGDILPRHEIQPGEVIVANTEQGHDRLLIGYAAIVPAYFGARGLFSHHLYKLKSTDCYGFGPDYLCELMNSPRMHDTVSGYATGTTVNMLPADALKRPLVLVPPAPLLDLFGVFAATLRRRTEGLVRECQMLAATRDELLPRLISGTTRI